MTTTTARSHGRLVINERTSASDGIELRARARPIDNGVQQGEQRTADDENRAPSLHKFEATAACLLARPDLANGVKHIFETVTPPLAAEAA